MSETIRTEHVTLPIEPIDELQYEIPTSHRADMRVPARVWAGRALLEAFARDRSLEQLVNVCCLPGVVGAVHGMPDLHEGYGFPVGGVAATLAPDGAISPGGIGFDINCGVRLLRCDAGQEALLARLRDFVHAIARRIPAGYGKGGPLLLNHDELSHVLAEGCAWLVHERGLGEEADLDRLESGGCIAGADPEAVSPRARQRGSTQLGTLGGGNHFIEIQRVDAIEDEATARAFGLHEGHVTVMIHSGSRGLGHQVCTDAVRFMDEAAEAHGFDLPDRQLACAPLSSSAGRRYFAAMCAAANFAFANRQVLMQSVREAAAEITAPAHLSVVYDVAHNIAKLEEHGGERVCVHRKGATRAFGPGHPELPDDLRPVGQPVFIPGSMGTRSYVLVGRSEAAQRSLASACHGAGRSMSRRAARREAKGARVRRDLEAQGIIVRCSSDEELAEEAPHAYKDAEAVVDVVHRAGIATRVARLRPVGVLKG